MFNGRAMSSHDTLLVWPTPVPSEDKGHWGKRYWRVGKVPGPPTRLSSKPVHLLQPRVRKILHTSYITDGSIYLGEKSLMTDTLLMPKREKSSKNILTRT